MTISRSLMMAMPTACPWFTAAGPHGVASQLAVVAVAVGLGLRSALPRIGGGAKKGLAKPDALAVLASVGTALARPCDGAFAGGVGGTDASIGDVVLPGSARCATVVGFKASIGVWGAGGRIGDWGAASSPLGEVGAASRLAALPP
jgi:hypothetical protein